VVSGNIPFSEVIAAWYQANNWDWERLLIDSGKLQLVRSCKEPREIATASTVMRIAKALLNEINAEDNIPYYDEFVKDIGQLEKANGVLDHRDDLRKRIVTFIAENYTPREAGRTICPACLVTDRSSAGGRNLLHRMKAQPLECLIEKGKRAMMAPRKLMGM